MQNHNIAGGNNVSFSSGGLGDVSRRCLKNYITARALSRRSCRDRHPRLPFLKTVSSRQNPSPVPEISIQQALHSPFGRTKKGNGAAHAAPFPPFLFASDRRFTLPAVLSWALPRSRQTLPPPLRPHGDSAQSASCRPTRPSSWDKHRGPRTPGRNATQQSPEWRE